MAKTNPKRKGNENSMLSMLGDEIKKDEANEKEEANSVPTVEESNTRRKTINLADFLIEEDPEAQAEEDNDSDEEEEQEKGQIFKAKTIVSEKDSDVIKCGMLKKKAHSR